MTTVNVTVEPGPSVNVSVANLAGLTGAIVRGRLEAATPTPVALVTGVATTVASWLVDSYGSRSGELVLTKSDGTRIRRRVEVTTDSTTGGDATATRVAASGVGTSADFDASTDWVDATLGGTGTGQTVYLKVTAAANGPSWTTTFVPDFDKVA